MFRGLQDKADFVGKTYSDEYVGPLPCRHVTHLQQHLTQSAATTRTTWSSVLFKHLAHAMHKAAHYLSQLDHTSLGVFEGSSFCDRYAIGVLDKATGKMQMMETEAGHLIRMHAWQPYKEESEQTNPARRASHKEGKDLLADFRRCVLAISL